MEHPSHANPSTDPLSGRAAAPALTPGQLLARGVCRGLGGYGYACVTELVPRPGMRVDVMALGPNGEIWVVECKSGRADYRADRKWSGYLDYADRFFWAVDAAFPLDILPPEDGLILADGYGAEIMRMAPARKLAPARRKAVIAGFARTAARRLQARCDTGLQPSIGAAFGETF